MNDDFNEDTLETIEPIQNMRKEKKKRTVYHMLEEYKKALRDGKDLEKLQKELKDSNIFVISRDIYDKTPDQNIEAWFTKFDDVIIDDTDRPYKDPLTKKEKLFAVLDKFNAKNINKGIDKFNKGVDQFSKVVASSQGSSKSKKVKLGISQKDYDKLFKSPKRKGNTTNFWNEDKKTRKRRNKRKPVQKAPDYSALVGKRKVKFF